jgi:hypothetical protein
MKEQVLPEVDFSGYLFPDAGRYWSRFTIPLIKDFSKFKNGTFKKTNWKKNPGDIY